jgi:ABC-2 type transport system ATP-binding protein
VRADGLTRVFDSRTAVENLTFSVHSGEVLALLGPNGAGKTTTFRMLAGLLLPTRGQITVAGVTVTARTDARLRRSVGFLTEQPGLWERLSVRANLVTVARLHGLAAPEDRARSVMAAVGITHRGDDRAGSLSRGLKQRVAIARALVHDPPVVLLDEPTAGLDPASAREIRDLVQGLRAEGRTVLVSTHNLGEAESLSDRIAVMNARLLALDTPRGLRERRRASRVVVEADDDATKWRDVPGSIGAAVIAADHARLVIQTQAGADVPDVVAALVAAGARVRRVEPEETSLEDAYLDLVRGDA